MAGPSRRPLPFVAVTGGIGAGKSEALAALKRLGAATLSSDAVVHALLADDEVRALLIERLGTAVAPSGTVDRPAVAAAVFANPDDRAWLESVLWPRVAARIAQWREQTERSAQAAPSAERSNRRPVPVAAAVEVPLLFESGMDGDFDWTVAVVANEQVRAARAGARGHAAPIARAARQLSQSEKAKRADWIVHNDGDLSQLEDELSRLLAKIVT